MSDLSSGILSFLSQHFSGIFGQSGVDYQDWVECHGRHVME